MWMWTPLKNRLDSFKNKTEYLFTFTYLYLSSKAFHKTNYFCCRHVEKLPFKWGNPKWAWGWRQELFKPWSDVLYILYLDWHICSVIVVSSCVGERLDHRRGNIAILPSQLYHPSFIIAVIPSQLYHCSFIITVIHHSFIITYKFNTVIPRFC